MLLNKPASYFKWWKNTMFVTYHS